jgi:MFS transporter, YNFM family, putative membrane transport protein
METKKFSLILGTTMLSFAALYLPQPILPVLAVLFSLTPTQAGLFTSLTMLPLGIMPVMYAWLLNYYSIKNVLRFCILALAISQLLFGLSSNIYMLLTLRLIAGLLLPGVFTCLVTLAANFSPQGNIKKAVNLYIAAGVLGGFIGRMLSGMLTYLFNWNIAFIILGAGLFLFYVLLSRSLKDINYSKDRSNQGSIKKIILDKVNSSAFVFIFLAFLSFASILNFIPFRIVEINGYINAINIASIYFGYLFGALIAYNSSFIISYFKSDQNALIVGIIFIFISLATLIIELYVAVFVAILFLCVGFFLLHSVLVALLNSYNNLQSRGIANGYYIGFYYLGGSIGTYLPGHLYSTYGWNAYVCFISVVMMGSYIAYRQLRKNLKQNNF